MSVPTFGAGAALAIVVLLGSVVLARRGEDVRRPLGAAVLALTISAASAGACQMFFLREAAVTGTDVQRHDRADAAFERAFDTSTAAPPRRADADRAPTLDAGTVFGDDGGSARGP